MTGGDRPDRILRAAGVIALAALLPGCLDLPEETKGWVQTFVVLLAVNAFLQVVLIALLLFYFLPFTRPARRRRRKK